MKTPELFFNFVYKYKERFIICNIPIDAKSYCYEAWKEKDYLNEEKEIIELHDGRFYCIDDYGEVEFGIIVHFGEVWALDFAEMIYVKRYLDDVYGIETPFREPQILERFGIIPK